jgi:tetratricopeptide (TPR) repeat protein
MIGPIVVLALSLVPQVSPRADNEMSMEDRGDLQMARKLYHEAIDSYSDAVRAKPTNAVAWNKLGIAYHQLLDFTHARAMYEKSVKLNHRYSEAINNLGTIFFAQKNYRRAIRQYEQALAIAPDSASIHSNLGTALISRKKIPEAMAEYQKALELDPEVFEHHNTYGVLLQERSGSDRALFDFVLARTYAGRNNIEKAMEYLRKAFEEGFKEQKKIYEDPAFAELVKTPSFTELIANPPVAIAR